ncbi:imidazole glycerol phosphate synthase subunit HisH [Salsipaludibacter albus]|uniref:imidazole glycerol phosphate synthase subunit HisH n=1 Tax=Salsipaludibacter albus TaxID=2849650 RepID=UPI001EE4CD8D|nr:imidazole glycerol phosphate synthase subunit HisH [Salsipaludibacter albus]
MTPTPASAAPRAAVLDYGAGNVRSAKRGFDAAGADAFVTDDVATAAAADVLVIPGVGHIASCLANLRASGMVGLLTDWIGRERPVFGICVGMQLLYGHSAEGDTTGLGLLPGAVRRFTDDVTVPHMGWDVVTAAPGHRDDPILAGVAGERCYFVHSYFAVPDDPAHVVATCDHGAATGFPCVVREGSVVGTQFHPEKSGEVGHRLLRNWLASLS